jgi:hypothetical protein
MAPNARRLIGIAFLVIAAVYGLYWRMTARDETSLDPSFGQTGQPAD